MSRDLTPENLRKIADWFDTYDKLAEQHFDLLEKIANPDPDLLAGARKVARSKEIQNDLRRWAEELQCLKK